MDKDTQIQFFDDLADQWTSLTAQSPFKLQCLVELCALRPGARILEVACGSAALLQPLLHTQAKQLVLVDFSQKALEEAKAQSTDPRLTFYGVDIMELVQGGFDCAILYNAFPYFENRGSLTRQMHHLLAQCGRLFICHTAGRTFVNSTHQSKAAQLALPLPTAQTLSGTLSQYFDVDTLIDSQSLYVVSGLRKAL